MHLICIFSGLQETWIACSRFSSSYLKYLGQGYCIILHKRTSEPPPKVGNNTFPTRNHGPLIKLTDLRVCVCVYLRVYLVCRAWWEGVMLIKPLGEHYLLQYLCPTVLQESWISEKQWDEGRIQLPQKNNNTTPKTRANVWESRYFLYFLNKCQLSFVILLIWMDCSPLGWYY